jgi:transposase-like protein
MSTVIAHTPPEGFRTVKLFDEMLRREARSVALCMIRFQELIVKAKTHHVHEELGFKSWTAYIADVIGKEMTNLPVDDRRQVVALLAGEGVSQRAIAAAVGVSQKTVDRDLDQVSHDDSPADQMITDPKPVTGLDGKIYPANPKPKPDRIPAPATFARLKRKLRDLNRMAEECWSIAEDLDFDDLRDEYNVGDPDDDDLDDDELVELRDDAASCATDVVAVVEDIVAAIEGWQ